MSVEQGLEDCLAIVEDKLDKYKKALDKTCSKLEEINVCPHMSKKEWKEWSLKDE